MLLTSDNEIAEKLARLSALATGRSLGELAADKYHSDDCGQGDDDQDKN